MKTEQLPCRLTDQERQERATKLAQSVQDAAKLEADLAGIRSKYKTEIERVEESIRDLSKVVSSGLEYRPIEVIEQKDAARRVMETIRQDTGEIVWTRPLSPNEMQEELHLATDLVNELGLDGAKAVVEHARSSKSKRKTADVVPITD